MAQPTAPSTQPSQPAQPAQSAPPPFIDNPSVVETFADSLQMVSLGNGVISLTFTVTRTEDAKPPKLTRNAAARLVVTLPAAIDLHQKLSAVLQALQQSVQANAAAHAGATPGANGPGQSSAKTAQ